MGVPEPPAEAALPPSGPWTDLALTLPIFCGYHVAVVFLDIRNAADVVTREFLALAHQNVWQYWLLTLAIGVVYVGVLALAGRGHHLRTSRFVGIAVEGVIYAVAMRLAASWVIGELQLARGGGIEGRWAGFVMSLGAGFYEEVLFRVGLYGLGAKLVTTLVPAFPLRALVAPALWAIVSALVFSGWHYVGELGDAFQLRSFVFRAVCGLAFTVIYQFRGFAPAVWTHTLYDVWVLAL